MNNKLLNEFLTKTRIPYYVAWKHIVPYTYITQNEDLQLDIINYKRDINLVESRYYTQYDAYVLLVDLLTFNGFSIVMLKLNMKIKNVLKRHIILKNFDDNTLLVYLFNVICKGGKINAMFNKKFIKFLWGLMNIQERTIFIEDYILIDEIE